MSEAITYNDQRGEWVRAGEMIHCDSCHDDYERGDVCDEREHWVWDAMSPAEDVPRRDRCCCCAQRRLREASTEVGDE